MFIWNGMDDGIARATVALQNLCPPKKEGGLGINKLVEGNRASIMRNIWLLFAKASSLWVAWMHENLL